MATSSIRTALVPAAVGEKEEDVDTPAFVLDLVAAERNILTASEKVLRAGNRVSIRPHFKAHKCSQLAHFQMKQHTEQGVSCVGMCAQKVCEAEALVAAGILDVFISNQIVGHKKIDRIAKLCAVPDTNISVAVDDLSNAESIAAAVDAVGARVALLVEMDVGQGRCGKLEPEDTAELAEAISTLKGAVFKGLHCYHGAAQHIRTVAERQSVIDGVVEKTSRAVEACKARGLEVEVVTGGGTGSLALPSGGEAASDVFTEIQPGSYVLHDVDYSANLHEDGEEEGDRVWKHAMFILSTVHSRAPSARRGVLDSGFKSQTLDSGPPRFFKQPQLKLDYLADEHAVFTSDTEESLPPLGTKLRLIPGHVDPTANLHDYIVGLRDGVVDVVWPVDARGPGF